ncbi:hypothetical protein [Nocardia carnea]|uniref:hypothetical protein n=1 Tax=Nocardia carnea TaxID=37328 RepID=UPI002459079A|nr:hypothetical protein [Nocardia carnea]
MSYRTFILATLIAAACSGPVPAIAQPLPPPGPPGVPAESVPARSAVSVRGPNGLRWGTPNEFETRSALSMAKLYLADYALRRGDGSAADRMLAERMIRLSDDAAADTVAAKYPQAIGAIAAEYGLAQTAAAAGWNTATTSTADIVDFLAAKQATDPASPIFGWMASAPPVAADGTQQNWGTARLPGVQGTKWGWSDLPPPEVASASFGPGFTVAAHTRGSPDDQTADVEQALAEVLTRIAGGPAPVAVR